MTRDQKQMRLLYSIEGALLEYLGCQPHELGKEWCAWAVAVRDATVAEKIDYSAIGRLSHAAVQIACL